MLNKIRKLLTPIRVCEDSTEYSWGWTSARPGFSLMLHRGGYDDPYYSFDFCIGYGFINFKLPFTTKLGEGCDMPRYGVTIHGGSLWIYAGGKFDKSIGQMCKERLWTWYFPWFTWEFDSHELKVKGDEWREAESDEYSDTLGKDVLVETHPYTYTLNSGEIQNVNAKCYISRRTWHRKWFPWVKKVQTSLEITFDGEVGERAGSWKGGCIGCGWAINEGESMVQCLRRMEKERRF